MVASESSEVVSLQIFKRALFLSDYIFLVFYQQKQPPEVFCKKVALKNFAIFTGKTIVLESLFNKVAGLQVSRPATLLKRVSNTGAFL